MQSCGSWRWTAWLLIFLLIIGTTPARGGFFESLSVEKEKQIGEEFFLELQSAYPISTDPFVSSYINRLGHKIEAQLPPHPYQYRFYILEDPSLNAFAVPGGYIFINSGFIRSMEREGELAGVLAHEISHIYARHLARQLDEAKGVSIATVIGSLAAVLLGGPAAAALLVGSQAAGQAAMLKYSRDHEQEADDLGFKWMLRAGYNPRDMISVFRKLSKQRWFQGGDIPTYLSTHPHTDSRLVDLANQYSMHEGKIPVANNNPDFNYFALKVESTGGNPYQMLRRMTQAAIREPNNPVYLYGKGLALGRLGRPEEAEEEFQEALKLDPGNFIIQREIAIQYFERNRYQQALPLLLRLSQTHAQDEVVLYYLGRIYQEQRQTDQALAAMERVQSLNPAFVEVYQNLGTLYGETGRLGLAHYYLGLHSLTSRAYPTALFHFKKSLAYMPITDPRYSRVRDQITRLERMKVRVAN
jgi:predicted Zn-dependent protease|uniref:Tetratricopeptide repeat protein n=1 Tax=Desulfobacca acetoxidans TaxID=60893 RepID=A0A7C3Z0X1_9BACT